ncbi:MAG: DUF2442 domain-containing protein [Planctomycetaceae bacterium]
MLIHVTNAEYVADHRLHLWFNDGASAEVDLSDVLEGDIFAPLKDITFFQEFRLEGHTVVWPNGADFAPEYLHRLAHSPAPT